MAKEEEHGSHPAPRWEIVTKAYDMIEQRYRSMVENAQQYNKAVEVINKRFTNE